MVSHDMASRWNHIDCVYLNFDFISLNIYRMENASKTPGGLPKCGFSSISHQIFHVSYHVVLKLVKTRV